MRTPDRQLTPDDNDPIHCQNEGCDEGYIYKSYMDEDNIPNIEREKCPYCEDGIIID